jgi:hypothetical protein
MNAIVWIYGDHPICLIVRNIWCVFLHMLQVTMRNLAVVVLLMAMVELNSAYWIDGEFFLPFFQLNINDLLKTFFFHLSLHFFLNPFHPIPILFTAIFFNFSFLLLFILLSCFCWSWCFMLIYYRVLFRYSKALFDLFSLRKGLFNYLHTTLIL